MTDITTYLGTQKVIPVVAFHDLEDVVPVCEALLAGGITVIEITLRSDIALAAVERAATLKPALTVGVGTIKTAAHITQSEDAGADFLVSPGATPSLRQAGADTNLPFLLGAATVSEAMENLEAGFTYQKFFPASASGGAGFLKGLQSPVPEVKFCPTGGIDPSNAQDYLALSNVYAVGMSWLVPGQAVADKNWGEITRRAKEACAL